jgi:hypothetical protein
MTHANAGTRNPSLHAVEPMERARLTLHDSDPITGNEETLSSLFYEFHRGYTIYSTPRGRCCIHGKQGCIKLRGKFVCFYDVGEAKTLIRHLRRAGYTAADSVERRLPQEEYVWLNWRKLQRRPTLSRPMRPVS